MKALLERYMKQFAVMDSLVGQSKSERTGIENSFKGMSNSR
jgi:flagellar capping protein FliD